MITHITPPMNYHPILFSGPMVRAILAGRKTMTRRVIKDRWGVNQALPPHRCPYGSAGDLLWVRETWGLWSTLPKDGPDDALVFYRATDEDRPDLRYQLWRPSIFMPRWASRLSLEVTAIRAERVQDISEEDAVAEGMPGYFENTIRIPAQVRFQELWDKINAKKRVRIKHGHKVIGEGYPWSSNPWVWVVSFRRLP